MPSAPIRLSVAPPFELWRADLADTPGDDDFALLDADERARAARFHFERHRGRYVSAHGVLRRLLADRTGRPAASLVFRSGPYGKPALDGEPRCAFSLSHCDELALVALADDGEIGVDLERVRELPDLDALARQCLTRAECLELAALPTHARPLALLARWTRKEACLKALGTGLQIEPSSFAVGADAAQEEVGLMTIWGHRVVLVQAIEPAPGWIGAVARVKVGH
jgi:4'-phosphopantetheinyl transferase